MFDYLLFIAILHIFAMNIAVILHIFRGNFAPILHIFRTSQKIFFQIQCFYIFCQNNHLTQTTNYVQVNFILYIWQGNITLFFGKCLSIITNKTKQTRLFFALTQKSPLGDLGVILPPQSIPLRCPRRCNIRKNFGNLLTLGLRL